MKWLRHLISEHYPLDAIKIISVRMRSADSEDYLVLARELANLWRLAKGYTEARQVLDDIVERYPDDVLAPMSKASLYLYSLDDAAKALSCINVALDRAYRTGHFRRQALGVKARILLKLGRGDELSDVLEEIMSLQMRSDLPDIGRERDFVDGAPPGFIREDVLSRYDQFRPRRKGAGRSDEPPEFEPAEDWE